METTIKNRKELVYVTRNQSNAEVILEAYDRFTLAYQAIGDIDVTITYEMEVNELCFEYNGETYNEESLEFLIEDMNFIA